MLTFLFCMDGCITKMVHVVALTFCFLFFNPLFAQKIPLHTVPTVQEPVAWSSDKSKNEAEWRPCMEQRVLEQVLEGQKLLFQQKFFLASHHSSFIIFSRISRITHDSSRISHYSFITCHFLSRWWFHFFLLSPLFGEDFPFD